MKTWFVGACALLSIQCSVLAAELPPVLAKYFNADESVRTQIIEITPPAEFEPFVQKISEIAQKDPQWFEAHSEKTPAGSPIPVYDEKLGMTREEYDQYIKFWENREVQKLADTELLVREAGENTWKINGAGPASALSLLKYNPETNSFKSPNGELVAIADVNAPAASLLGAWSGQEWRFLSENTLTKMKENIAIGSSADGAYSFLIYRVQEVTSSGRPLFDKSLMLRFPAKK